MAETTAEEREAKGEALARAQAQGGRDALFGRDGQDYSEAYGGGNQSQGRAPCRGGSVMNEYIPCKRRDPTAWEAIGRVRREEKERRKREAQEKEREADEERSKRHAGV